MTAAFEILSIDLEKKRIGVALLPERLGARRRDGAVADRRSCLARGRTGKVERHEKFGVFVFLAPGRTGLIPMSETGVAREADVAQSVSRRRRRRGRRSSKSTRAGRRIRLSVKAIHGRARGRGSARVQRTR